MNYWRRKLGMNHPAETGIPDPYYLQQERLGRVRNLVGQRQTPYEMSEGELFPGESPVSGLMNKGTGLVGGELNPLEFYGGLLSTPGYENIAAQGLRGIMPQQQSYNPMSPIGKLLADRQMAINNGATPDQLAYFDNALQKAGMPSGTNLTINPDGSVSFQQGTQGLTKPMLNKVQEKLFNAHEQLASLRNIKDSFRPEFLQIGTRAGLLKNELKDKLNLGTLTPEETNQLSEYSTFKQRTATTLNNYIKSMSGAAVSVQEAQRLQAALPVAGQGVFDGDSPSVFKAKMKNVTNELRRAAIRYQYAKIKGLSFKNIPLSDVDRIVDIRGGEIERELKMRHPSMQGDQLELMVRQKLSEEFGI